MNKKLTIFIVIISGILFGSCYADLDLEKYRPTPKAVLNCSVFPDTVVMASISRTWFFTDQYPNITLKNATVELYVNGSYKEQMQWSDAAEEGSLNADGIYISSFVPHPGDAIKVVASTEYGTVWAEDTVPSQATLDDIKISYRSIDDGSIIIDSSGITPMMKIEVKYEITFRDNANETNYYLIRISDDSHRGIGSLDYSSDPIFIGQKSILEGSLEGKFLGGQGGRTFSDETINGKEYTLIIKETGGDYNYIFKGELKRKITLFSLSQAYYQYLSSLQYIDDDNLMHDMADYGLAEPVKIYSNILGGGTGILGAGQKTDKIKDLREILPES